MSTWGSEQQQPATTPGQDASTPAASPQLPPSADGSAPAGQPSAYPPPPPAAPAGYGQPYPQAPAAGQLYPGQAGYPGQAYPGQQAYPQQGYQQAQIWQPTAPKKKNPLLGQLSLAVVVVALGIATWAMGPIATIAGQFIQASGSTEIDQNALQEVLMSSAYGPTSAFGLATMVGSVASIVGLIAGIIGRGRGTGIAAFIVGLLAPVIWFTYMMIVMMPYLSAVAR